MDRKTEVQVKTVTREQVRSLLQTAATRLSAEEERVLRARHSATLTREPLSQKGEGHAEAQAEMLAIELAAFRERRTSTLARDSDTKDKIVRALRKKR